MVIESRDDGARIGTELGAKGIGVGFEGENVAARADDFIFVDSALVEFGNKDFPKTGRAASTHRMNAAVPTVEIAYDADPFCAWGPDGKMNAANAFESNHMGAELFVGVVVPSFAHEIQIKLTEDNGKDIGVKDLEGLAGVCTSLNLVAAWGRRSGLGRGP